ncbi:MAG TPA: FAD-dependent oxidoreductase [Polyangiaceae bacterium]|nr:FAD-dependent oxidoreductase [Polyangiaceae bacterium]
MPLPPTFQTRVAAARMLTPSVRELLLERTDGAPFVFEAGQWVSLVLPVPTADGEPLRRSYSIASPPDDTPRFAIAVTRVEGGPGSCFLSDAPVGTELAAVGPQGFFTRPMAKTGPSLFVGTGTGLTPLRSIMRDALAKRETRALWLLLGGRQRKDLLYREELDELAERHGNVRVHYTLSRPDEDWTGRTGYVQTHVRELWSALAEQGPPHAYICGLHDMVGAVRDLLRKEMGAPREQVHSERYD